MLIQGFGCLHLNDNSKAKKQGEAGYNKLHQICPRGMSSKSWQKKDTDRVPKQTVRATIRRCTEPILIFLEVAAASS